MAKVLKATQHDIGGLDVNRILPHQEKRMVGPFIFFDQMGPSSFPAGQGINVKPHPHIGLSTLTYLFDGRILHRDSLGNHLEISPGDVNWMTAGKGIVHSERESFEVRANPHSVSGLQCWVALPEALAELEPAFSHVKKEQLPNIINEGVMMRLVVGEAYGLSSPVKTYSPMFYIDVVASQGSEVTIPDQNQETAIFTVCGEVSINGETFAANQFILLEPGDSLISSATDGRYVMLGGDKFEQVPFIHWNFVSFKKERIKQAKEDWINRRFPNIPGDDKEFFAY
ncbi:pirin family protein [Thalassomonas sp. M1454]|uniref:pirin family protein n=1 Tax=Thalassomonas sp. M1454 TaxID=2594477 RepID=UPI00117FA86F|nr:pirin family protein [Thalassomonas sp. M1454]TRX54488.1 pirin family protein [Thalassomonas sp. M1454]